MKFWGMVLIVLAALARTWAADDFSLLKNQDTVDAGKPKPAHARAELIADTTAIEPGKPFRLGVRFTIDPGWHIYGPEPGALGLPTKIEWQLPEGFKAGPLQWPPAKKFEDQGQISIGYAGTAVVFAVIEPAANPPAAQSKFQLGARASWLVCKDQCITGDAKLALDLPAGKAAPSRDSGAFAIVRPESAKQEQSTGTLGQASPSAATPPGSEQVFSFYQGKAEALPLWKIFLLAFLGGIILNVMPCVLPVLSLKVLGFVRQAGESRARSFRLGLAYTAGVLLSFAALAGVVVALQAAGRQVGQGFQLQDPRFVAVASGVILAVALSLLGVYTIELPGEAINTMDRAGRREGYGGALLSGVLATALATPCTAPFLGSALAFTFTQPPPIVFSVFMAWGLGLAAPYLALAANPGWLRWVPRPGRWMLIFEQAMGFVMLGFAIWLLGVLGAQAGPGAVVWTLAFLLAVAVGCWLLGLAERFNWSRGAWAGALALGLALAAGSYMAFPERYLRDVAGGQKGAPGVVKTQGVIAWEPFSVARVENWVKEGRTVFVDFTADWCQTCKFNEWRTLETPRVRDLFERHKVVPVKADWTSRDETIGQVLRQFGSAGVPLYVIFPAGRPDQPMVLPTLLTAEAIERGLEGTMQSSTR